MLPFLMKLSIFNPTLKSSFCQIFYKVTYLFETLKYPSFSLMCLSSLFSFLETHKCSAKKVSWPLVLLYTEVLQLFFTPGGAFAPVLLTLYNVLWKTNLSCTCSYSLLFVGFKTVYNGTYNFSFFCWGFLNVLFLWVAGEVSSKKA